jgi:NAD(P)H-dependent FMN reductase
MSSKPKILAFAGSAREASVNKRLIGLAAREAQNLGADVTLIDLRDFPIPMYDGDLEDGGGVPESARRLREFMVASDGFMLASPEYNGALSPLMKNVLDWTSRPPKGETGKLPFAGKPAALMSASPGGFGGFRGLMGLHSILFSLGMHVLPDMLIVPMSHEAFSTEGLLNSARQREALVDIVRKQLALAELLRALR